MALTTEQIKDLRPLRIDELIANGTFYLKDPDGTYRTCNLSELEIFYFRPIAKDLIKQGRLFIRKNAPFKSFVEW
jgi:hypothetical protein